MMDRVKRKKNPGQSAGDYVLITAIVAAAAIVSFNSLGDGLTNSFKHTSNQIANSGLTNTGSVENGQSSSGNTSTAPAAK